MLWDLQVSHILDELVKLLHERNGWKAALKQSQVEMLTMEKKYVAQMRHRLVGFLPIPLRSHSRSLGSHHVPRRGRYGAFPFCDSLFSTRRWCGCSI